MDGKKKGREGGKVRGREGVSPKSSELEALWGAVCFDMAGVGWGQHEERSCW